MSLRSLHISKTLSGVKCGICKEKVPLYRCPACDVRTCSIECSRSHKGGIQNLKCSGKKNIPSIKSISDYTSDKLIEDYEFLADVKDNVDRYARLYSQFHNRRKRNSKRRRDNKFLKMKKCDVPLPPTG